jgi:hypothetical protein
MERLVGLSSSIPAERGMEKTKVIQVVEMSSV